jgi:hypothetical protein
MIAALTAYGVGVNHASAQPSWSPQVERWGVEEVTLSSARTYANPFTDVQLTAAFRCGAKAVQVNGFYDGDGAWKVRFMPDRSGACTFKTASNDRALNGISGDFTVGPPGRGNHGPVHVAKASHFAYADGTPYFLLGTTSYNWLNRSDALQEQTLASLRRTAFNKIRFGLFPKWYKFNRVEPTVFPYVRKADGSFDFDRFDPRFFKNVDRGIRELGATGVEADIILFHSYDHWGFAQMDEAHNLAWLRYVTARLGAYRNVWWTMANEYDLMTPRDWNRLGQAVRDDDPYGHPLGIHNLGVWYDPRQPWIDHVELQEGSPTAGRSAAIARRRYGKPVVVEEYGYEGNNSQIWGGLSAREEIARHWDITMAGGYASHGETYVHPDGVLWWSAGGELVGESPARLAFLKAVMTSLPFQDMTPAPELINNGTALALPGKAYLFYFPWSASDLIMLPSQVRLAGADLFKVELVDPWQMKIYPLGYTSPGDQTFTMSVAPALLRITAVDNSAGQPRPIGELIGTFAGDVSSAAAANPARFKVEAMHYSLDFQIAQLQMDSAARAVLEKYLPAMLLKPPFNGLPLSMASAKVARLSSDKVEAMAAELAQIPVE